MNLVAPGLFQQVPNLLQVLLGHDLDLRLFGLFQDGLVGSDEIRVNGLDALATFLGAVERIVRVWMIDGLPFISPNAARF